MKPILPLFILILAAIPALAQEPRGKEFLPAVAPEDVDNPALYQEIVTPITVLPEDAPLQPNERRLVAHTRPVWHVADDGTLAPINTDMTPAIETLKAVWRNDTNTIKFRVTEDGVCVYRVAGNVLRVRPAKAAAEATGGGILATADQAVPTETIVAQKSVIQRGSFTDVRFEHAVESGSIKETAWLDTAPPGISTARWYALTYRWNSETLTPTVVNGDVVWKTASNTTLLRWPAPVVTDAAGKDLRANYRVRIANPNVIDLLVNATDLRAAIYPVGIDPTTTTVTGANLANRSIRSSAATLQYKSMYFKLTMPTMSGNTVTACTWNVRAQQNYGPANNLDYYARATSGTGAWDDTSSIATLDALAMGTAISTGNTLSSGTGAKTLDIFGDSTKGVSKFYADNPTGGSMTIAVKWSAYAATNNTAQTLLMVGDSDLLTRLVQFYAKSDAAFFPTVTITYTAAAATAFPLLLIPAEE